MSADLRRKVAYFGPREKIYPTDADAEIPGLPRDWRRVLCMAWPSPVCGPCGIVYGDVEHAIAAFRAHYTTNNPALAQLYRPEHEPFNVWRVLRRWSTSNGLSLLLSEPDDRVWFVIRDRCMFDLVYQRVCRDESYRKILSTVIDQGYMPVYHVRTADNHTYWGAIIDRTKINLTQSAPSQSDPVDLEGLAAEKEKVWTDDPSTILVGKNRLGRLMVSALEQYRRVYEIGISLRAKVLASVPNIPQIPLSPIALPRCAFVCTSPSSKDRTLSLPTTEDDCSTSSDESDFVQSPKRVQTPDFVPVSPKRVKLDKDIDDVVDSLLEIGKEESQELFI